MIYISNLFTDEKTELRDEETWQRHLVKRRHLEFVCRYSLYYSFYYSCFIILEFPGYGDFVLISNTWFGFSPLPPLRRVERVFNKHREE